MVGMDISGKWPFSLQQPHHPWPANLNVLCGMLVAGRAVCFVLGRHEFASHQVHVKARSHAEEDEAADEEATGALWILRSVT